MMILGNCGYCTDRDSDVCQLRVDRYWLAASEDGISSKGDKNQHITSLGKTAF